MSSEHINSVFCNKIYVTLEENFSVEGTVYTFYDNIVNNIDDLKYKIELKSMLVCTCENHQC